MNRGWGLLAAGLVALAPAATVACAGSSGGERATVLAAASLIEVLPEIEPDARYSFAGSDTLAAQIREGAPADVFVAANTRIPEDLQRLGRLEGSAVFATNRLALLVPEGNPANVRSLADLKRDGLSLVMADAGVPAGDYTRDMLAETNQLDLVSHAVSQEQDVNGVVQKVALGEADAGFAYATDIERVGKQVDEVPLQVGPASRVEYEIAVVASGNHTRAAREFVSAITGPKGRVALRRAGFGLP